MLHTRTVRFDVTSTVALFEKTFRELNKGLAVETKHDKAASLSSRGAVQRTFRVQKLLLFLPLVFTRSEPRRKLEAQTRVEAANSDGFRSDSDHRISLFT